MARSQLAMVAALVSMIGALGCGSKKRKEEQPATARTGPAASKAGQVAGVGPLTGAELERLATEISSHAASARARKCERPVLRGSPTAGPAARSITRIVEAVGSLATCHDAIEESSTALGHRLDELEFEEYEDDDGVLTAIEEACAPLYDAIAEAAGHQDACSPYLVGRQSYSSPYQFLKSRVALAVQARSLAMGGHPAEALRALLDAAQLGRDLARGGADALITAAGLAWSGYAVELARQLLDHYREIPPADLERLAGEVDRMLAHRPTDPSSTLEAEYISAAARLVRELAPDLLPENLPLAQPSRPNDRSVTGDPRQDAALMLLSLGRTRAAWAGACPAGVDLRTCHAAIEELLERGGEQRSKITGELEAKYSKLPIPAAALAEERERLLAMFATMINPAGRLVVSALVEAEVELRALRIDLELRRIAAEAGRCATVADANQARIKSLLSPPGLGGSLEVELGSSGHLEIWAPEFARGYRKEPEAVLHCFNR